MNLRGQSTTNPCTRVRTYVKNWYSCKNILQVVRFRIYTILIHCTPYYSFGILHLLCFDQNKQQSKLAIDVCISYWTLDVSWTASYEITLCPFVCLSVCPSLNFLKIGSLVFSDIVHDDSGL